MRYSSVISIDIGSCKTKIAVGKIRENNIKIENVIVFDTPAGCMADGNLVTADGKAELFKNLLKQVLADNKIKYKDVVFTIQSTTVIRRELELPIVKPSEMANMIRYEIGQYLPIDLDEYIIEYKIPEEKKDNKVKALVAALPKAMAESYLSLVLDMKLEPMALDINSNAASKLFSMPQEINGQPYQLDKAIAVIDLGCRNINVSILSKGFFQFSRLIPTGGYEITRAIAEAYGMDLGQAEERKISEANLESLTAEMDTSLLNGAVRDIVLRWTDEIQRVFQYYKTRNSNNDIHEVYLHGGTSNIKGLGEFFTSAINIPTQQIKSLSSVIPNRHIQMTGLEFYLNAFGAIMRK